MASPETSTKYLNKELILSYKNHSRNRKETLQATLSFFTSKKEQENVIFKT